MTFPAKNAIRYGLSGRAVMPPWYLVFSIIIGISLCLFGLPFTIGGYTIRIDRLIAIASFLNFLVLCSQSIRKELFRPEYLAITVWLVLALLASLLSASPSESLRHWLDLSLAISLFITATYWRLERLVFAFSKTISPIIVLMGGGAVIAAVLLLLHLAGEGSWIQELVVPEENYFRLRMTMLEPNLYGALMMILSLLSVATFRKYRPTSWLMLMLSHAGLVLSISRGPIAAYFVGLLIYYYCIGKVGRYFKSLFVMALLASILVSLSDTPANSGFYSRIDTIETRLITYRLALSDIEASPLFGSGIYSFSYLHPEAAALVGGSDEKNSVWISNILLAVLHDTGLVGFALYSIFFYALFSRAYKAIVRARRNGLPLAVIKPASAWLAAGCGILVSSQATSAYSLGAFWIVMAIIAMIPRAMQNVYTPGLHPWPVPQRYLQK